MSKENGTAFFKVKDFHEAMDQPIGVGCAKNTAKLLAFRTALIAEEYKEFVDAVNWMWQCIYKGNNIVAYKKAKENVLKELQDIKYVIEGFCVTYGYDSDQAFDIVHKSNMSKLVINPATLKYEPYKDKEGKVMKGPNYVVPFLGHLTNDDAEDYSDMKKREELDAKVQADKGEDRNIGDGSR